MNKVNLKLGKVAAKDIEYVESAATEMNKAAHKTADSAAYLNKKTGEILAEGIDMARWPNIVLMQYQKFVRTNLATRTYRTKLQG